MTLLDGAADFLRKFFPSLKLRLQQANISADDRRYTASALIAAILFFLGTAILLFVIFLFLKSENYLIIFTVSLIFGFFIFLQRMFSPNIAALARTRDIERNLLPVLQSIYVQINSGISLFEILVNISKADYGEISIEFLKTVKQINGGKPQIDALEELAAKNPSLFFRKALWQIINGMKAGAEISTVINETISTLSEEQLIQIQSYGARLAPLAMFYMFTAVIIPALSLTFIILFLSFTALPDNVAKSIFYGLYFLVLISQIIFTGFITSRRPSLL